MLNIIKTALHANSHKVSVVSNNIANASTTAFKRSEAIFEDFYLTAERRGLELGSGAKVQSNRVSHNPAQLKKTGVSSDLAINGHGMLIIGNREAWDQVSFKRNETPLKLSFTRNGSLQLNEKGFLTTKDGQFVLSKTQKPIQIEFEQNGLPLSEFNVNPEGYVMTAYGVRSAEPGEQLGLAYFNNPEALSQLGNGRFLATDDAALSGIFTPGSNGTGLVLSGHLEVANVDLVKELVSLISTQQAFSAASKAIQADNDIVSRFTR